MYIDEYTGRKMAKGQMAWLVEKRDRLPEENPKTLTIDVSANFSLDEERELGAILAGCSEDMAPSRFADESRLPFVFSSILWALANLSTDVKIVCKVRADFSDIPVSRFPRSRNPKTGKEYFEVEFKLRATFQGGNITWQLMYEGQEWGSTTVSYDE